MKLQEQYKRLFKGKPRSNDSRLLKENKLVDVALKLADKMSYQQLEKLISVDDGSVDGRDREATGTIEIGGAVFNWTLETGDGMTAIYLEDESLEDDGALYEPILGVVNDEGYELEEEEYGEEDW
jgi:hypothetical protein